MLRDAAISCGQLALMLSVARDETTTYARLSRELMIDATAVARAVKTLAARGFFSVDEIKGSQRKTVAITESGIKCLRKAIPLWQTATNQFFQNVDEGDWRRIRDDLARASVMPDRLSD